MESRKSEGKQEGKEKIGEGEGGSQRRSVSNAGKEQMPRIELIVWEWQKDGDS